MRTEPWTDAEMLEALYMRDHQGMTGEQIGKKLGRSKNSVIGMWNRVNAETERSKHDGKMGPRWWAKGIEKQKENNK